MAQDSFKGTIFGLILFTLFTFMLLFFVDQMGDLNNVDTTNIGGDSFDIEEYNESLQPLSDNAQDSADAFREGELLDLDSAKGVKSIMETIWDFITTPFTIMSQILNNILGVPPVVTGVFTALFIMALIFGLWRVLRIGD